eukprot:GILK01023182.1.p1 GENE.GILK01023182.1~~GILK01023182.1.p1  ORF type:complete len:131 (+),score=5.40 GILK01023182.1:60-395(+)
MQAEKAEDWVCATGEQHSVREFAEMCFERVGLPIKWQGSGESETGVDATGRTLVRIDPRYYRPTEVETLLGDPTKLKTKLGWQPEYSFVQLVDDMVKYESEALSVGKDDWA